MVFYSVLEKSYNMKKACILLLGIIVCYACRNTAAKDKPVAVADTQQVMELYPNKKDTKTIAVTPTRKKDSAEGGSDGNELKTFYDEELASYAVRRVIDSAFTIGADHFKLHSEHYCLMDSGLTIPKGYAKMYKLDSFVTHNFVAKVRLEKNDRTILQRTICKKDFNGVLAPSLRKYASLRPPYLHLQKDSIWLEFSISIPLTDVGVPAYAAIGTDGGISFRDEYALRE